MNSEPTALDTYLRLPLRTSFRLGTVDLGVDVASDGEMKEVFLKNKELPHYNIYNYDTTKKTAHSSIHHISSPAIQAI